MNNVILKAQVKVQMKAMKLFDDVKEVLKKKEGSDFTDTALKMLIAIVIGGLLLAGLYGLFKDTLLPTITDKIKAMFEFKG